MRDRDEKLNKNELVDIRSLIGDADSGGFTLDEIMSEYGRGPRRARPAKGNKGPRPAGKVVAFPGAPPPPEGPEPDPPEEEPVPAEEEPLPPEAPSKREPAPVIPFPQEENAISAFFRDLSRRADDYEIGRAHV